MTYVVRDIRMESLPWDRSSRDQARVNMRAALVLALFKASADSIIRCEGRSARLSKVIFHKVYDVHRNTTYVIDAASCNWNAGGVGETAAMRDAIPSLARIAAREAGF